MLEPPKSEAGSELAGSELHLPVPVGHHVRFKGEVEEGLELERDYTPVFESLTLDAKDDDDTGRLHFLIKTYEGGAFTPIIKKLPLGEKEINKTEITFIVYRLSISGNSI